MANKSPNGGGLSNEEKREYLRQHGVHITSDNKTYVQRIYASVQKQVASNLKPSLTLARRGSAAFTYVPARKKNGRRVLPRFEFRKGEVQDIEAFIKASNQSKFTLIVTGKANADSPRRRQKRNASEGITLGLGPFSKQIIQEAIDQSDDMLELINYLSPNAEDFPGLEWDEITSVSILQSN